MEHDVDRFRGGELTAVGLHELNVRESVVLCELTRNLDEV